MLLQAVIIVILITILERRGRKLSDVCSENDVPIENPEQGDEKGRSSSL
jgi:hypothetical protein